jgi:phage antirepressor YoqD-like protein
MEVKELLIKLRDQLEIQKELLDQSAKVIERQNKELTTWKIIKQPESDVDMKNAADILKLPYVKGATVGRNLLFEFLRYCGIICISQARGTEPYHKYIPKYFNVTEIRIESLDQTIPKTIVTQDGLDFIRNLYEERGDEWILNR